jgi:hypothetical protein
MVSINGIQELTVRRPLDDFGVDPHNLYIVGFTAAGVKNGANGG